jgi:hypothetical protein
MTPEEKALDLRKRQLKARLAAATVKQDQSPSMAEGMAALSGMSKDPAAALAAEREPQNTVAGTAAQFGVGTQSGIANALGFPVDAVTGGINGLGSLTGMWGPIQNPVGGSASIDALLKPLNKDIPAPQTGLERGARRVGEEVGASAAMLPLAMASPAARAAPMATAAVEGGSALGAGTAAAVANEVAPDSMTAEIVAALAGGIAGGKLASKATGMDATDAVMRSGIDEQKARASDAYGEVRADTRVLPQDSVDDMALGISSRMDAERLNPRLQPGSAGIMDAILQDSSGPMRIEDVENLRRMTTQNLPATANPADRRLSRIMTDEITAYLDSLDDPVADALKEGRTAHRRASAASAVTEATDKAARRAARTGTGGNEINASRQNISALLENPRKARSFKADELAAMDEIVRGTTGQNAMRRLSRMAPSSGGLSSMLGIGGAMASPQIALPIMAVTEGAKALGERSTKASIAKLLQSLAPDRVLKPSDTGIQNIISALLAARTTAGAE